MRRPLIGIAIIVLVLLSACGEDDVEAPLTDLQLVGVDFQLDSIIITNAGTDVVRTQGLWAYQDGEISEFGIFMIEPRTEILFSLRDLGGLDASGGEVALFSSDSFSNPDALIEYVAWGGSGHSRLDVAIEAGRWNEQGSVETTAETVVILRADPNLTGPEAWSPSEVIP